MRKLGRKLFALLLCVMLCSSLMPAYAERETVNDGAAPNSSGGTLDLKVYRYGSEIKADFAAYGVGWNQTAKLRVKADGGGKKTYQWYTLRNSDYEWVGTDWVYSDSIVPISGATKSSYTPPEVTDLEPHLYACIVTDQNGDDASVIFYVSAYVNNTGPDVDSTPSGVGLGNIRTDSYSAGYYLYDESDYSSKVYEDYTYLIAEKYRIYRKESGGSWAALKTFTWQVDPEMTAEYLDKTALMGSTYSYRYRAYLNGTWGPYSAAETVKFNPFYDVNEEHEAFVSIAWAYNNNVVKGDGMGHFNPDDPCTRMNFVMILWKMHGKPAVSGSNPFSDVSGTTSVSAVKWAVKKKLVTGTSATTFSPDDNLSRINIIMILYKLAGSPKSSAESPYEDISGSKTAKAVNWAVENGIIAPEDSTHFDPSSNCSRALLVEILCKYNEIYKIL